PARATRRAVHPAWKRALRGGLVQRALRLGVREPRYWNQRGAGTVHLQTGAADLPASPRLNCFSRFPHRHLERTALGKVRAVSYVSGMMSPEWLSASARYNRWMNDKLYGLAATLSDTARRRDGGAFFKSIHGTFNHLLLTDRIWLARFKGVSVPQGFMGPGGIRTLDQELYADFEELRRE